MERPDFFTLKNGEKVKLPFSKSEYDRRVNNLRTVMDQNNLDMVILTSMHNIAIIQGLFIVHLEDLMVVWLLKIRSQLFQQILMQVNLGEDHIVIT
jgi:hypothetical protein